MLDNVEKVDLDGVAERTLATGIIPYPPGIPLIHAGENANSAGRPCTWLSESLSVLTDNSLLLNMIPMA